MAMSMEKVTSNTRKMCRFSTFCACAKCHPGLCSPFIHSVISNDSVSRRWRPLDSFRQEVQANLGLRCPNLGLRCPQMHFHMAWPILYDLFFKKLFTWNVGALFSIKNIYSAGERSKEMVFSLSNLMNEYKITWWAMLELMSCIKPCLP